MTPVHFHDSGAAATHKATVIQHQWTRTGCSLHISHGANNTCTFNGQTFMSTDASHQYKSTGVLPRTYKHKHRPLT